MSSSLLELACEHGTPIIDVDTATFVWEGAPPPLLTADHMRRGFEEPAVELERVSRGLWSHSTTLPIDAYVEYTFLRHGERVLDPFNQRKTHDGVVGYKNFFSMPAWQPSPLLRRLRGVRRGTVTRHVLTGMLRTATPVRAIYLYDPPFGQPCPLLVVYDGNDYLKRARLPVIVDNLMAAGRIHPIAMAMLVHGKSARFVEYDASEATLRFLDRDVLPFARHHLRLLDPSTHSGSYGVLGASMGGLMAVYTAIRLPHLFGAALSQSGAFGLDLAGARPLLDVLIESTPRPPTRVWMDVGRYDMLLDANRAMHELLARKGYDVIYREYNAGHNYTTWRNDVWRGLEAAFPPRSTP